MKTNAGKLIWAIFILVGLAFPAGAVPILVGESQLSAPRTTLSLGTARNLVAQYNARNQPADLPLPDAVTKAGTYGFSPAIQRTKNLVHGAGYFQAKAGPGNPNSVQLFYSADPSETAAGVGGLGSGGGAGAGARAGDVPAAAALSPGRQGTAQTPSALTASDGNGTGNHGQSSVAPKDELATSTADGSNAKHSNSSQPIAVPDAGVTLWLLTLALGAIGVLRRPCRF